MKIKLRGKKIGMTQIFDQEGKQLPVTVIEVRPSVITQIKNKETDGYTALQLGCGEKKERKTKKSQKGLFQKAGVSFKEALYEIKVDSLEAVKVGAELGIENFEEGDYVDICGVSIGKGFQGVVKRHNFAGGPKSHGSMFGREPGSVGQSAYPSRVFKGMKLPGHMGNRKVTVQNLKVVKIDEKNELLVVDGAVPGASNAEVFISLSLKKGKEKPLKFREKKEENNKDVNAVPASESAVKPEQESSEDAAANTVQEQEQK